MRMPINHKYLTGRRLMLSGVILLSLTQLCGFRPTADPTNLPRRDTPATGPRVWSKQPPGQPRPYNKESRS